MVVPSVVVVVGAVVVVVVGGSVVDVTGVVVVVVVSAPSLPHAARIRTTPMSRAVLRMRDCAFVNPDARRGSVGDFPYFSTAKAANLGRRAPIRSETLIPTRNPRLPPLM